MELTQAQIQAVEASWISSQFCESLSSKAACFANKNKRRALNYCLDANCRERGWLGGEFSYDVPQHRR
jgi:hypothetical protein